MRHTAAAPDGDCYFPVNGQLKDGARRASCTGLFFFVFQIPASGSSDPGSVDILSERRKQKQQTSATSDRG